MELRRDKCKHFHVEYLTDPEALHGIFKNEVYFLNWQFLKFVSDDDAKKCFESHCLHEFSTFPRLSLNSGEAKARAVARLNRMIEKGEPFDNVAKACATFSTYARGLHASGYDYGGLCELVRLALESRSAENAIKDVKTGVFSALE